MSGSGTVQISEGVYQLEIHVCGRADPPVTTLGGLSDVDVVPAPTVDSVLVFDPVAGEWVAAGLDDATLAVNELGELESIGGGGSGGVYVNALVRSDGFDPEVGTFTELIIVGPVGAVGNRITTLPRSASVGGVVAVIDTGEAWVITASGPCTPGPTILGGQSVVAALPAIGGPYELFGVNGTTQIDPTAPATSLVWADAAASSRRLNNFVTSVADGNYEVNTIEPDPEGAVIIGGGLEDGLPVYRLAGYEAGDGGTITIDGQEYVDPQTVVALVNQLDPDLNGIWEMMTDEAGDYGTAGDIYFVLTVRWNSTTDNDPTSPWYSPSANVYYNGGGDHEGLWATVGNGTEAVNSHPVKVAHLWDSRWDEAQAATADAGTIGAYLDGLTVDGLDATGVDPGKVPTADGDDAWTWETPAGGGVEALQDAEGLWIGTAAQYAAVDPKSDDVLYIVREV
jgi:hypothetical protein